MEIRIVEDVIAESALRELAKDFYGHMIKAVIDVDREIIAFGGEYHMDANVLLIEHGSQQLNVWGFNWYFDVPESDRIEYTSLINIRPHAGNKSLELMNEELRQKIKAIVFKKIV